MRHALFLAPALLLCGPDGRAGWGNGRCAPVGVPVQPAAPAGDVWKEDARWPGWKLLWRQGRCVGAEHAAKGLWQDYDPVTNKWGKERKVRGCTCSSDCPCLPDCLCDLRGVPCCTSCRCAPVNYGLDLAKLAAAGGHDRYQLNGWPATREQARAAIERGQIPDDAHKLRLTVIGPEADRKRVLADLASSAVLAPWKDKLLVQDYPPDHWAVAACGFATGGKPTVYYQAADGKVLHRQDDYEGGAEALALALRKADPDYRPDRDPDRRKPEPAPPAVPGLPNLPPWAPWAAAGAALLLLLLPRTGVR